MRRRAEAVGLGVGGFLCAPGLALDFPTVERLGQHFGSSLAACERAVRAMRRSNCRANGPRASTRLLNIRNLQRPPAGSPRRRTFRSRHRRCGTAARFWTVWGANAPVRNSSCPKRMPSRNFQKFSSWSECVPAGGSLLPGVGSGSVYWVRTPPAPQDRYAAARSRPPALRPLCKGVEKITKTYPSASRPDLRSLDWFKFEKLVAVLFQQEGFAVQRAGGANPDGGIDLVATKSGITFGVQCKHWKTWRVGVKEVRELFGALHDRKIRHGFFVTLEGYTHEAASYARRNNIELMEETMLLQNLELVNWRFNPAFIALLTDTRKVCPKCEADMVLRTAKRAPPSANSFGAAPHSLGAGS